MTKCYVLPQSERWDSEHEKQPFIRPAEGTERPGERNEFSTALDILIKLEDKLRERAVPPERYEMLLNLAHTKVAARKDIEDLLDAISRLTDIFLERI